MEMQIISLESRLAEESRKRKFCPNQFYVLLQLEFDFKNLGHTIIPDYFGSILRSGSQQMF